MQISEITSIVQNVVLTLSAVATVIIAYKGLSAWRKELKGKSEYTIAREVLKAVYKVYNAFLYVRNPAIFIYEYPEDMQTPSGHLKNEKVYEGTTFVYDNRWNFLTKAFHELEEKNLDAQVEWGSEFQKVIDPLRSCMADLQAVIHVFLYTKKDPNYHPEQTTEKFMEDRSTLYYENENSKFDIKLTNAIKLFEKQLRPYIKK